jgi:hypothetical protein
VSVGRKYFKAAIGEHIQYEMEFHLDNWRQRNDYNPTCRLFADPQDWADEKERDNLIREIREVFSHWKNPAHLTLEALRKIQALATAKAAQ